MSDEDYVNDWFSDDETHSQLCNVPTPACHSSPSEPNQRRDVQLSRRTLPFMQLADWDPSLQYNEEPPYYIRYELEWKLTLNKRVVAKQTEQDLVVAPGDFWNEALKPELNKLIEKIKLNKPCQADATTIIMSVTERSERNITKRFDELNIEWPIVERQLQAWSHFFRNGKKLIINIAFNYVESKTAGPAGRGSTAGQVAEMNSRYDAEVAVLGRPDAWRHVYQLFRCPGAPCDRGPYCWQDPTGKKHYKLLGHHLRSLVRQVQQGFTIQSHDDTPKDIRDQLYAEEQQHLSRKRKRTNSGSYTTDLPTIHIHNIMPSHSDKASVNPGIGFMHEASSLCSSSLEVPGLRDDAVMEYCAWHCSKVRRQDQKDHYELARDLLLDEGFDLELINDDKDAQFQFLIDHGVMKGVARHFVRDVEAFLRRNDRL